MGHLRTLSAKLGAIGAALLLTVLASIGLTLWVTWQLEGGAAAVNEAGRLRMQTWHIAQALPAGDEAHRHALIAQFEDALALLGRGDPARPLFVPRDEASQARLADVRRHWTQLRTAWTTAPPPRADVVATQAEDFVARVDVFVGAIESQLARWTAVLHGFQLALVGIAIASAIALLYAAYLFVFSPLARMQAGLARLEAGDLAARVEVEGDDEFGALSAGFNRMATTLQQLYGQLEARVRDKTLHLEAERQRLAALYEAAAFTATAGSLDELARGFARQVRRVAGADACAIRWSDEANRRYVILASDCLPQAMVEGEHCVATGACACGQAAEKAGTRVIPIRTEPGGTPLGHCAEAGFETVVGVPVRLHDRVVGEIDLFYRSTAMLSTDDRALVETLAAHLAGAMESLRAAALEREAAVADERGLLARELHDSIAQSLAFLKIQVALLRDAVRRQDAPRVDRTLDEIDAGVRESLLDVRELLVHFRTRTNAEDIAPALRQTLQKFEHQTGLATHLEISGDGLPLAPDVQVQVLHVVQEALSNVRKHADAHAVWVDLRQGPRWQVAVRDDGHGFDERERADDETHVGLRIMRERAARIGGEVAVESTPGRGTQVTLTLPAAERLAA